MPDVSVGCRQSGLSTSTLPTRRGYISLSCTLGFSCFSGFTRALESFTPATLQAQLVNPKQSNATPWS